jgi:hypothetical protein
MLACCRYARVLTWVKAGLLTVEDVVRGATNAAMEAREASRGVMRPRNHPWGVMTWSQQVGMLACLGVSATVWQQPAGAHAWQASCLELRAATLMCANA